MESNTIKINDRYSIKTDEYNWILLDTHTFKSKKKGEEGKIKSNTKMWYPSTLERLCEIVLNDTPKQSTNDMREVHSAILQAKSELFEAIKQIPYKHTHK